MNTLDLGLAIHHPLGEKTEQLLSRAQSIETTPQQVVADLKKVQRNLQAMDKTKVTYSTNRVLNGEKETSRYDLSKSDAKKAAEELKKTLPHNAFDIECGTKLVNNIGKTTAGVHIGAMVAFVAASGLTAGAALPVAIMLGVVTNLVAGGAGVFSEHQGWVTYKYQEEGSESTELDLSALRASVNKRLGEAEEAAEEVAQKAAEEAAQKAAEEAAQKAAEEAAQKPAEEASVLLPLWADDDGEDAEPIELDPAPVRKASTSASNPERRHRR